MLDVPMTEACSHLCSHMGMHTGSGESAVQHGIPDHVCTRTAPSFGAMCAECSQIVHRDVKAPNVLLREVESRWDVCISDFGTTAAALSMHGRGSNHA